MQKRVLKLVILLVLIYINCNSQELPNQGTVLYQMKIANKYFMDKWPDPGADIVTDKVRPSNLWTRATYYEGLMSFYYIYPDSSFYNYAVAWGDSNDWRPTYNSTSTRNADNQCCGQTYIELYLIDNQPERIEPITTCIDRMVDSPEADDWWWIDAIQMAMPIFAKLGVIHNDTSYFRKMHDLYSYTMYQYGDSGLYNQYEHLWWRDANFDPPYQTPNDKNCYWSRGNGWVLAALARVLDVLPDTAEHRNQYIATFQEMADTLANLQRADGFWNPSLVDSLDYGGKETSGTAFFTFGLAWGINHGILDSTKFIPNVIKGWNGMAYEALHLDGMLGYVQGTGKEPSDEQPLSYDKAANFEDYGLGAFLLAGSEVYHLAPPGDSLMMDTTIVIDTTVIDTTIVDPDTNSTDTTTIINIGSRSLQNDWLLYPNPTTGVITIEGDFSRELSIYLFDVNGRKLMQEKLYPSYPSLNLSLFFPGTYFLKISNGLAEKEYRILRE